MRLYIVSGILLIVPIVDFALGAPVLVQEKRQASTDMADIVPEYTVTALLKRGEKWGEIEEVGGKYIENWFVVPKDASAVHGPSSSAPEPGHASSSSAPSEPGRASTSGMNAPAPNPGPSTGSDHLLAGMDAPLSSPVYPTWFHPDNQFLGAHSPRPNTGPSNPSTEFNSENRLVGGQPPPLTKGSSTESTLDTSPVPPSSQALSTAPNRESLNVDSSLDNLQLTTIH